MLKWGRSRSFLEWAKFYTEWNNYSYAAHKCGFFRSYSREGISFSSRSMNIGALAKVLVLTKWNFLLLVLRNNYSLNARNFGRLEYISFWLIYILIWYNLCIFWINGNNLKTAHSKIVFWDSLKKTLTYWCFCLSGWKGIDSLKSDAYTASFISCG